MCERECVCVCERLCEPSGVHAEDVCVVDKHKRMQRCIMGGVISAVLLPRLSRLCHE